MNSDRMLEVSADPTDPKKITIQSHERCKSCQKTQGDGVDLFRCSVCGIPYCSVECQKKDWPVHKHICRQLGAQKPSSVQLKIQYEMTMWTRLFVDILMEAAVLGNDLISNPDNMYKAVVHIKLKRTSVTDPAKLNRFYDLEECDVYDMEIVKTQPNNYKLVQNSIREGIAHKDACVAIVFVCINGSATTKATGLSPTVLNQLQGIRFPANINWKADLADAISTGRTKRKYF